MLYFASLCDSIFIFIFTHDLARIFIPKKIFQIPVRIKWSSPKRYAGPLPLFELGYRPVKTNINRIFPCHFILPCFVIFPDISFKTNGFEIRFFFCNKTGPSLWKCVDPPLRYMYIVVQCGLSSTVEDSTTISVVDCVRSSCSLGELCLSSKQKTNKTTTKGLTLFSITNVVVLWYEPGIYGSGSLKYIKAI